MATRYRDGRVFNVVTRESLRRINRSLDCGTGLSMSVTTPLRMPVLTAVPLPTTVIEPPSPPMWAMPQLTLEVPMSITAIVA